MKPDTTNPEAPQALPRSKQPITQRNVSKRLVQPELRYLDDTVGPDATDRILESIGLDRLYFEDVNGFMPLETSERLFKAAIRISGDPELPYHFGRALFKYMNRAQVVLMGLLASPALVYANLPRIEQGVVKTTRVAVERLRRNHFRITISFSDGYQEPQVACRNRHGTYEAIPTFFGLPYATVNHPRCVFRGDPQCVYEVKVPEHPFHWARRLLTIMGIAGAMGAAWTAMAGWAPGVVASCALVNVSLALLLALIRAQTAETIEWGTKKNLAVESHALRLAEENRRTEFLHTLTLELNRHMQQKEICSAAVDCLMRDFGYNSCQIWLVESDGMMRCAHGGGLSEEAGRVAKTMEYSIEEGRKYPDGFVVRVIVNRDTLLINDVPKATSRFTKNSRDFFALLNPSSIIVSPLVDKDAAFGMLVGAHHDGTSVTYLDRVLFESTAPIVANALAKARLYESMERKIAQRGEEIARNQRELMAAREMAIQSEKLSALGRLAVGVAHEINNPLNFLVNIVPDLRSDVRGLSEILSVGRSSLATHPRIGELLAVVAEAQLDEHIAEADYVFNTMNKALNKAQRVVSSLRVFSRMAAVEPPSRLRLLDIMAAAYEVIPPKYRTSVDVRMAVAAEHSIVGSNNHLVQAFVNIMQNSLEAMGGAGALTVTSTAVAEGIEVRIQDTGPGIPEQALPLVFEPFFTTKSKEQHTGLGLTVARELLGKYGGVVTLSGSPGGGAVCTVRFRRPALPREVES